MLHQYIQYGAIQVLRNAVEGGRVSDFTEKSLRRCTVQRYYRYEGAGGCQISRKNRYVPLEWPLSTVIPKNRAGVLNIYQVANNMSLTIDM